MVHGHRWTGPIMVTGDERLSQVPGEPIYMHAPLSDPGGLTYPSHDVRGQYCLPENERRRPHLYHKFRGSMTRPTCSLSTLHRVGHPSTAQDSLPVRWLDVTGTGLSPVGFRTRISSWLREPPFPMSQTCLAHSFYCEFLQERIPPKILSQLFFSGPKWHIHLSLGV